MGIIQNLIVDNYIYVPCPVLSLRNEEIVMGVVFQAEEDEEEEIKKVTGFEEQAKREQIK